MHRVLQAPLGPDTFWLGVPEYFQSTPSTELIFSYLLSILVGFFCVSVSINGSKKLLAEKMTCYRMGKKIFANPIYLTGV